MPIHTQKMTSRAQHGPHDPPTAARPFHPFHRKRLRETTATDVCAEDGERDRGRFRAGHQASVQHGVHGPGSVLCHMLRRDAVAANHAAAGLNAGSENDSSSGKGWKEISKETPKEAPKEALEDSADDDLDLNDMDLDDLDLDGLDLDALEAAACAAPDVKPQAYKPKREWTRRWLESGGGGA